jgi:Flp pilus assembly CpaF family ATPase
VSGQGCLETPPTGLLVAAVDVVVHLARDSSGRRVVVGLAVLRTDEHGRAVVVPAYRFEGDQVRAGPAARELADRIGTTVDPVNGARSPMP